jgi:flagellar basal body-associated protein FliL
MDRKQVIIVALLIVAIVLSTASVMLNVSVFGGLQIKEAEKLPFSGEVGIGVLPSGSDSVVGGNAG